MLALEKLTHLSQTLMILNQTHHSLIILKLHLNQEWNQSVGLG